MPLRSKGEYFRAKPKSGANTMLEKILIANRGDQPPAGGAAAQPNRVAAESCEGGFTTETLHV
jgi:hypothetical protein